jgi:RNA recognition motif-containing protein
MKTFVVLIVALMIFSVSAFRIGNVLRKSGLSFRLLSSVPSSFNSEGVQVFVGNLPFEYDEKSLSGLIKEKFSTESLSLKIIKDKTTGKSRGFGYITYPSKSIAQDAVSALANINIDGRMVKVDIVDGTSEKTPRTSSSSGGSDLKLFVGNLDFKVLLDDFSDELDDKDVESVIESDFVLFLVLIIL